MAQGNTLAELTILLRAELAQLKDDLGKANQLAQQSAKEMSKAMREQSERAKDSLDLLADSIGVRLPRELKKAISETSGVGRALSLALPVGVAAGFAATLAEQVVPAVIKVSEYLAGWGAAAQAAYKDQLKLNAEALKTAELLDKLNKTPEQRLKEAQDRLRSIADQQHNLRVQAAALSDQVAVTVVGPTGTNIRTTAPNEQKLALQKQVDDLQQYADQTAKTIRELNYDVAQDAKTKAKESTDAAKKYAADVAQAYKSISDVYFKSVSDVATASEKINLEIDKEIEDIRNLVAKYPQTWQQANVAISQLNLERQKRLQDTYVKEEADLKDHLDKMMQGIAGDQLHQPNLGLNLPATPVATPTLAKQQTTSDLQRLMQQMFTLKNMTDLLDKSFENWQLDMTLNSKGVAASFGSMAKSIISSIEAIIAKMLAMYLVQKLIGFFLPGSATDIGKSGPSIGGGGIGSTGSLAPHDYPGPASPMKPYRVGVPEVFIPNGGYAIPLSQYDRGSNITIVNQIDARGASDDIQAKVYRAIQMSENRAVVRATQLQNDRARRSA